MDICKMYIYTYIFIKRAKERVRGVEVFTSK